MKHARDIKGLDVVGHMSEMTGLPGMVIACLRQWNRGGEAAAHAMLRDRMGAGAATAPYEALQDLAAGLGASPRRPLRWHAPDCHRVGADEASVARFVEEAALGEREDALMLASLLVEARGILSLTDAAARLGLWLYRAALCDAGPIMPDPASPTRH